ncbi:MAG: hypothetical protein ACMUJM_21920 [bacterium]
MKYIEIYSRQIFLGILIIFLISISFPRVAACQFSIGDLHRFPSLRDDKEENKWFRNWIAAFPGIKINYPAVRIGTQQIDVRDIPHEWDIANPNKGWPDYMYLIWGEGESQTMPWFTGILEYYSIFSTFKAAGESAALVNSSYDLWTFPTFDYVYNYTKYDLNLHTLGLSSTMAGTLTDVCMPGVWCVDWPRIEW